MLENYIEIGKQVVEGLLRDNEYRSDQITAGIEGERLHVYDTHKLVLLLTENRASPALQIAALGHDVERFTVPGAGLGFKGKRKGPEYEAYKKEHAKKGAEIISRELRERGLPEVLIDRVAFLITHHDDTEKEVRSLDDEELDILVAADSFSFLNTSAPDFLSGKEAQGIPGLRDKLDFMLLKLPARLWSYLTQIQLSDARVMPYLKERAKIIAEERAIPDPFEQIPNG